MIIDLDINSKPETKKRPRLSKGHVYSPSARSELAIAWEIKRQVMERYPEIKFPLEGNFSLSVVIGEDQFKLTLEEDLNEYISVRGDIDNYLKLIMDCLQKSFLISNDKQIVRLKDVRFESRRKS